MTEKLILMGYFQFPWFMVKVKEDIKHNKKMKWIRMSFEEDSIHGLYIIINIIRNQSHTSRTEVGGKFLVC